MKYTIHNIQDLTPKLLPKLAQIHMGDHGLLSELGYPFVERYFEIVYQDKKVVAVYAQDDETGEFIGYNIASPDPASLTSRLTADRAWFIKQIIKAGLTRPLVILQLLISSVTIRTQMKNESDAIESLYLTVNPNYRGKGMGRIIQQGLFKAVREAGYQRIVGSIEVTNQASINMCLANGFTITKTFHEGKYTRYRNSKDPMTTHRERIQACLNGEKTDRTPIALWRHFPVDDQNPEILAASTLHFQQIYDFDIVKVTPASSFAVKDWGVEDKWMGDSEGSRHYTKRIIHDPTDWEKLPVLDPNSPHLAGQLTCLRLLRQNLDPETPLIQTIFNPLAQAKNLAGNEMLIAHIRQYPEAVVKGLETIAKTTAKFIESVCEIGVDGIFYAIQHAQAGLLSLDEYKSFGLPFDQQTLAPTKDLWCNMLHLHGRDVYFSLLRLLHFQIVNWHDRETHPSLSEAQSIFKGVLCGGLRQDTLVLEEPDKVMEEAQDAIRQTNGKRFILGTGCVVPITASHGNLMAARKIVK